MKTWMTITILTVAISITAALASTGAAHAGLFSDSWRYKMTVEVETPEGLKTGSAVREVTLHKGIKMSPEETAEVDVRGEAVAVDLGKRGVLFALLRGAYHGEDYGADILFKEFPAGKKKKAK